MFYNSQNRKKIWTTNAPELNQILIILRSIHSAHWAETDYGLSAGQHSVAVLPEGKGKVYTFSKFALRWYWVWNHVRHDAGVRHIQRDTGACRRNRGQTSSLGYSQQQGTVRRQKRLHHDDTCRGSYTFTNCGLVNLRDTRSQLVRACVVVVSYLWPLSSCVGSHVLLTLFLCNF